MDHEAVFGAVGDISLAGRVGDDAAAYGADWLFERMGPTLARADVLFGNMESVAIPDDYPRDQVDPAGLVSLLPGHEGAAALKRAGFDFMNMAANHVLDAGRVGMDHTRACLEGRTSSRAGGWAGGCGQVLPGRAVGRPVVGARRARVGWRRQIRRKWETPEAPIRPL